MLPSGPEDRGALQIDVGPSCRSSAQPQVSCFPVRVSLGLDLDGVVGGHDKSEWFRRPSPVSWTTH